MCRRSTAASPSVTTTPRARTDPPRRRVSHRFFLPRPPPRFPGHNALRTSGLCIAGSPRTRAQPRSILPFHLRLSPFHTPFPESCETRGDPGLRKAIFPPVSALSSFPHPRFLKPGPLFRPAPQRFPFAFPLFQCERLRLLEKNRNLSIHTVVVVAGERPPTGVPQKQPVFQRADSGPVTLEWILRACTLAACRPVWCTVSPIDSGESHHAGCRRGKSGSGSDYGDHRQPSGSSA